MGNHLGVFSWKVKISFASVKISDLHFDCYVKNRLKTMGNSDDGEKWKILREM